ncbi:MAG TPA: ATP-binding cassette domain-containing protein, partial [Opitutales bacterium]|nr:ATP-binding cassette domain-containing protein [Opitutales bacterium]
MVKNKTSLTGQYLSGKLSVEPPSSRRSVNSATPKLKIRGLQHHNLKNFNIDIPLGRLVALAGVSGCGKSTLMRSGLYQGSGKFKDKEGENPAQLKSWSSAIDFEEILWVDQSPLSKTPRSNPAVYTGAWDGIRKRFGACEASTTAGFGPEVFSFNSKIGQCPTCEGLGFEAVDMQFLSDLYLPCSSCEGKRFKPEVLAIRCNGYTIHEILELDAYTGIRVFADDAKITSRLQLLIDVGLGYLKLGQPLNTLSGGEAQRLKLVRELIHLKGSKPKLCLLDEPTTGLHRHDVKRLLAVLQKLVDAGHSVVLIEHQLDVLAAVDWLIELGPGAGADGGMIVAEGTPEFIAKSKTTTAPFLKELLSGKIKKVPISNQSSLAVRPPETLCLRGAREHNLKSIDVDIPLNSLSVVTGVSGSGKSSLAFDVIFAEGQRRFMESMSAYIRQFIEQMPRADFDTLSGIPPTVAIEQRSTRGGSKSTVASITEVLPFLRLLFAKAGVQYNPATGEAVTVLEATAVAKHALTAVEAYQPSAKKPLYIAAQKIRH